VAALRDGRRPPPYEIEDDRVETAMREARIEENSPLWGRFFVRLRDTLERVGEAVACQADVEPWRMRHDPGPWTAPLPEGDGPLARLLRVVVGGEAAPPSALAQRLSEEARAADQSRRGRLERVTRGWRRATGQEVSELDAVERARDELLIRTEELRAGGGSEDDVLLARQALDEDLFEDAREILDEAQQRLDAELRRKQVERQFDALVTLAAPLPVLADAVEEVRSLLAREALDQAEARIHIVRAEANGLVREQRTTRLARLVAELEPFGAASGPLLAESRRKLDALRAGTGAPPSAAELDELQDRVVQTRADVQRRVERLIAAAEAMLEERRGQLPADAAEDVEQTLRTARERAADGAFGAAEELANGARATIDRRQVPTWTASQGEAALVRHLVAYMRQTASFAERDIRRLHVALKTKRFVILAGLTGSGKSSIARLYAEALGATVDNGRLLRIAVRPNWVDETEVLGYVNPLKGSFVPGWLATLIRACQRDPDLPFFCILDEMNLAPVEQYLADALSAMEEARSGSSDVRVQLYPPGAAPDNAEEWGPYLPWPPNLFLIGTVNVDETTRALSDRVLDRANVLQLSVEVGDGHHAGRRRDPVERPWLVRFSEWRAICRDEPSDAWHDFLVLLARTFAGMRIGLGMRSHVEVERFVANAEDVLDARAALDFAILQRLVPKVRGFKRDLQKGLTELRDLLRQQGCTSCVRVLEDWLDDEVPDEMFLDGTDARVGIVVG
jgi:hypothetical protein